MVEVYQLSASTPCPVPAGGKTDVSGAQPGPGRRRSAADCSRQGPLQPAHCDVPAETVARRKEAGPLTVMEKRALEQGSAPALDLLEQILVAAVQAAVAAGDLPTAAGNAPYPNPAVRCCTDKQRQSLPADVRFTSSAAFQMAAAIARRGSSAAATTGGRSQDGGCSSGGGGAAHLSGQPDMSKLPKQLGKAFQPPEGALSAQKVAEVLARHFNALISSGGTEDGTAAEGGAQVARLSGPGLSGSLAAWEWHTVGKPEAYAANGHLNIRLRLPLSSGDGIDASNNSNGPATAAVAGGSEVAAAADEVNGAQSQGPATASHVCSGRSLSSGPNPRPSLRTNAVPRNQPCTAAPPTPGSTAQTKSRHTTALAGTPAASSPDPDSLAMPSGRLQIRMVPSRFLDEEFELYKKYQMAQHGDEPYQLSRASYTRFLVDSPLPHVGRDRDRSAPECGYGSFHQQYWLDGKLIAVGVVDVLPRCLSSVYFFWDTSLASLALGRFSALQASEAEGSRGEILWVQRQIPTSPDLHYYYMGFYIHTCPKMRYKAEYRTSDLLCPVRKVWVRITPQLLAAIERSPYVALSAQDGALCQANLAARPTPSTAPAATTDVHSVNTPGGKEDCNPMDETAMDETLVLLPGKDAAAGPISLKVLRRCNFFSQRVLQMIENAIREWRSAVGWAAPSLVYQL
ncbi:hypothetical protein VOLCADRAFT_104070 [Volvox carteri f. nagariensis]|uniref:N-end rule aminoacyl transferase C-terminal domain-containing protein n=1 Tax=Volvox carteri f. nagariensis TaxID=3068 RepID=D8TR13_VOLCA|nr:uncharacterized protein VOLCADRAFT_104070 [Volvox carteri f. nagariensis]EFJ50120.1 hypothetical protein VOLCADRAFT_104070 [Volvox carteri f. nagariensis]|eukprot:XP_002948740.1 hypothetical protein VOLCADRAFT_104070 [Volvox carteri f. nagariensis]